MKERERERESITFLRANFATRQDETLVSGSRMPFSCLQLPSLCVTIYEQDMGKCENFDCSLLVQKWLRPAQRTVDIGIMSQH